MPSAVKAVPDAVIAMSSASGYSLRMGAHVHVTVNLWPSQREMMLARENSFSTLAS